ncbi:MAG TPA: NAD-dependent epimerase/dehydratase family protein [Myxococcales bacterium]|jgi:UDP-glucose 4-epimerase|nr:NAD-dependent epimerase/dehydratase family protein [Myxococcales bacterium]
MAQAHRALRVAVTGANADLGRLLLPRLSGDPRVESVLALDTAKPPDAARVRFRRLDLTRYDSDGDLRDALSEHPVDVLFHLALDFSRSRISAHAHELEVAGTMRVLSAVAQAKVPRVVVGSLTVLYGARGDHPALLGEDAPLHGCPPSRFVGDKVQVEEQVAAFRERHPEVVTVVLRFAPILGPSVDNPATRLLRRKLIPTVLGRDPLWQAVHEDDAARALHLALDAGRSGAFNVTGEGVLPFSAMVRGAGAIPLPLPWSLLRSAVRFLNTSGTWTLPASLLSYLQYSWVADGRRAREELGFTPHHHAREAVAALREG